MAVSEAGGRDRFKNAGPIAAAGVGLAAVVAGGVVLMNQPETAPTSAAAAATANVEAPQQTPTSGGGLAGVQFDQATPSVIRPGAGSPVVQGMEIVVKFKDDGKVKDIIDAFWKDQASARTKFEALKARRPELADLKLDRVTYSNELVLVHEGSTPADRRLAAMREIAAKLKNVSDISYAEPNMTAHPGGQ
jgi:hypothetical protein